MTAQEFAAWELDEPEGHEFFRGEVFSVFGMGGAGREHNDVAGNCYLALRHHLKGTPCRTFMADMKVHIEATGDLFLPRCAGDLRRARPCRVAGDAAPHARD